VGLFMLATALPLFSIVFANLLRQIGVGLDQLLGALV
jgi:hypothetical protein